jgi:hypothetical protein
MRERITRRRFLSAVGAGATYLALTNVVGCDRSERVPQARSPKGAPRLPRRFRPCRTPRPSRRGTCWPSARAPTDRPAAVAERAKEDELEVYVSWNGATEVSTWEVLAGPRPDQIEPLGSVPRNGFETALWVQTPHPYVAVRAKERSGRVLDTTAPVKV